MLKRIETLLARPRAPLWLGLFAVLICLPVLRYGLQADDHLFPWKLAQGEPAWSLFEMDGSRVPELRERGFLVWWSSSHVRASFLRPLASLSHALDFTLWPEAVWWMKLFNALIYGAAVTVAARLYRRFLPAAGPPQAHALSGAPAAGWAALMFALDDRHAFSAGWISGRNTLLAALFALLALWFHARARAAAPGPRRASWLLLASTLCVVFALFSAEAGVWSLSLLLSYALAREPGNIYVRLRTIAPQLLIGLSWAALYIALGAGLRGSSFYRDPSSPLFALTEGLLDLPIWFSTMFGPGEFALSLLYPALWVRLGCALASLGLGWLLWPALRTSPAARFFALAFLLCLVPLLFTLPTARVLIGPSFGAFGWVACSVTAGRAEGSARGRWTARVLLSLHVVLAALLFVPVLDATQQFANGTERILEQAAPGRDVIIMQAPVELLSNYALLAADMRTSARAAPHTIQLLYTGSSELWVERSDARTLEVEVARGWGYVPIERIFCTPEDAPRLGSEVRLAAFSARVLASTVDGMPQRVRFVFPTALEAEGRQWLTWQDNRVVPWQPPAIGARVRLAPLVFLTALR
jgi:hypothetical protein